MHLFNQVNPSEISKIIAEPLQCVLLCCYRYAKHYIEDKKAKRTLFKVFGIRIDIIVKTLVGCVCQQCYIWKHFK